MLARYLEIYKVVRSLAYLLIHLIWMFAKQNKARGSKKCT